MGRVASVSRKTGETDIKIKLDIDGTGKSDINTGIGFFDHMLDSFARHGLFDLEVSVKGDLYVDSHHTIEDTGIVLEQAIREEGNKGVLSVLVNVYFQWMKCLCYVHLIYQGVHTLCLMWA